MNISVLLDERQSKRLSFPFQINDTQRAPPGLFFEPRRYTLIEDLQVCWQADIEYLGFLTAALAPGS